MATASIPNAASLRLKLDLPASVLNEYERQAEACGQTLEEYLADRLTRCVSYTSSKPIYITDSERQQIEILLRRNVNTAPELIKEIRVASSIRVDNVRVNLSQEVRRRLTTRHLDKTISYDEHVARIVKKLLQEFVGQ